MSEDLADRIEALDVVEVTQADREAAADVWRDYIARIGEVMAEKAIRKGISDDTIIVQAFARHRITALRLAETSAALPDDVAKLKKQLQDEYSLNGGQGAYAWRSRELCGKAAAALTAQAQRIAELEAENARLRKTLATIANSFNIVGSHYDHAVQALDAMVRSIKTQARAALGGSTDV